MKRSKGTKRKKEHHEEGERASFSNQRKGRRAEVFLPDIPESLGRPVNSHSGREREKRAGRKESYILSLRSKKGNIKEKKRCRSCLGTGVQGGG